MPSILEKARLAATNEVKKIGLLIFLGVQLLFFGVIFGVPVAFDVNLGRVLAVLGFILTLIGSVGAIITYYEVYNDYLTANIPELQAGRVLNSVRASRVQLLEEGEEVVKPRTVQAEDLWVETPTPLPLARQRARKKQAVAAGTAP